VLIGTSTDVVDEPKLMRTLQNYNSSVKPPNAKIVFMLVTGDGEDSAQLLSILQMVMLEHGDHPILLARTAVQVLPLIEKHLTQLGQIVEFPSTSTAPVTVLAHATSAMPSRMLSKQDIKELIVRFPSIKAIEEATRTIGGQRLLCNILGSQTAKEMIEFWEDEWLI
jgi:hypothetical protein